MKYKIDVVRIRENSIQLNGWVIGKTPKSRPSFAVLDSRGKDVPFRYVSTRRDDVSLIYYKEVYDKDFGFDIQFPYERGQNYFLFIHCDRKTARIKYNEKLIAKRASVAHKRLEKIRDLCNLETVRVAWNFFKDNGLKALFIKSKHKLQGIDNDYEYAEWYDLTKPTDEELQAQRETHFEYEPLLSVVIPACRPNEKYFREMLASIEDQTYPNWEVCVADGSPRGEGAVVEKVMAEYEAKDPRFRHINLGDNLGIARNTNEAIGLARGDYIILADHDDTLTENALYEVAAAINAHPGADVIYSDEDKLDMDGGALFDAHFKPDFNPDLLCSVNYICHLFVVKRELLERIGGMRPEYDGAQDYDLIFRCTENAGEIVHIPKVLYHWRCHQGSTSSNPESKLYAFEAGSRAIMNHYERCGISADRVEKGVDYGIYHTVFNIAGAEAQAGVTPGAVKTVGGPLISVIIPNKDHTEDLDKCIRSLLEKGTYENLEFVVVENNSADKATFAYYDRIQKEFPQIRVVRWDREFNYSAINNFGETFANGDYLLFLNNDTEIIEPTAIEEMLGFLQRPDVGAVGAKLLYEDGTIQHAGVVVGFGGIAGHTFIGLHDAENSYFHRAASAQDYSAVTAACMMTKKSVFEEVGGFTEELAIAFNDIDYCMKVRAEGYLIVYAPYAKFYHYESKSRGLEDTPEKVKRFNGEIAIFARRWPDILRDGDPYYNPNLTLRKSNFALRDLLKEKIGEPYHLEGIDI